MPNHAQPTASPSGDRPQRSGSNHGQHRHARRSGCVVVCSEKLPDAGGRLRRRDRREEQGVVHAVEEVVHGGHARVRGGLLVEAPVARGALLIGHCCWGCLAKAPGQRRAHTPYALLDTVGQRGVRLIPCSAALSPVGNRVVSGAVEVSEPSSRPVSSRPPRAHAC